MGNFGRSAQPTWVSILYTLCLVGVFCGVYGVGIPQNVTPFKLDVQRLSALTLVLVYFLCEYSFRDFFSNGRIFLVVAWVLWIVNLIVQAWLGKKGTSLIFFEATYYLLMPIVFLSVFSNMPSRFRHQTIFICIAVVSVVGYSELFLKESLIDSTARNLLSTNEMDTVHKFGGRLYKFGGGVGLQASPNAFALLMLYLSPFLYLIVHQNKSITYTIIPLYIAAIVMTENRIGLIGGCVFLLCLFVSMCQDGVKIYFSTVVACFLLAVPVFFGNEIYSPSTVYTIGEVHAEMVGVNASYKESYSRLGGTVANIDNMFENYIAGYGPLATDKLFNENPGYIFFDDPSFIVTMLLENGLVFVFILLLLLFCFFKAALELIKEYDGDFRVYCFLVLVTAIMVVHLVAQPRFGASWMFFCLFLMPYFYRVMVGSGLVER